MQYAVKIISKLLPSLPTEIRIKALNCFEKLLHVEEYRNEVSSIARKWYNLFGDKPMDLILRYAKNPFPDIRLAGFGVLKAVSEHYWGQADIKNTIGNI